MLIGRSTELDVLAGHLAHDRPVVVVGEAGVGKTALLRAVAARSQRRVFAGGGLATLSWMPLLPLARALGHPVADGDLAWVADEVEREVGDGVLLVDDLQLCDVHTRSLLGMVCGRVPVLSAVRRGDPGAAAALELAVAAGFVVLPLEPLDEGAAVELVRRVRPDLPDPVVVALVERSGRNPLLLEELAATGEPSPSLRLSLAARLRDAGPDAVGAMRLLALAGRPVPLALLGSGAEALLEAGLATSEHGTVAVRHALLAEAALAELEDGERRAAHARLARALPDPGESARHHEAAGEREQAYAKAVLAASAATSRGERSVHLQLAAACARGADADRLRVEAAEASLETRDPSARIDHLLDAMEGDDPELLGRACVVRGWARFLAGDPDGMKAAIAQGLAHVAGSGTATEVRLRVVEARVGVAVDDFTPVALTRAEAAWRLARATGVDLAGAEAVLACALYLSGSSGWAEHLQLAMEAGRRDDDLDGELTAAQNLVTFHEAGGSPVKARELAAVMAERSHELRCVGWERQFRQQLVNLDYHFGAYGAVVDGAHALLGEPIDQRTRERLEQVLAGTSIDMGRFDDAARYISHGLATSSPDKQGRWWFLYFVADAALWSGRPAAAVAAADEALAWPSLEESLESFALLVRAWACIDLGTPPLDRRAGGGGIALLAGAPVESDALAALAGEDPAAAAELFDAAAGLWERYHRRGEMRCRWGAGEALRRAGDLSAAREHLVAAEARAAAHGMEALLGRIRRSLRLAGVHRSAERSLGPRGVTDREQQILALVAEGLTNVDISRRLGVSRSTVAAQLASASAKIGATSRIQAASLAGAP